MTDPISDMLTRIRNAQMAKHPSVTIPFSRLKLEMANILVAQGFVASAEKDDARFPGIEITLKYKGGKPVIRHVSRISKPGGRVYASTSKIPYVLNGLGVAIISTSQGLMTDKTAREKKIGGEVLCQLY